MSDTFHRFPELPVELQLMVWSLILRRPRTVALKHEDYHHLCLLRGPTIPLMQVNRQSRWASLQVCTRFFTIESLSSKKCALRRFPVKQYTEKYHPYSKVGVAINPEIDTIHMSLQTVNAVHETHGKELTRLRRLYIHVLKPAYYWDAIHTLSRLRYLDKVNLVCEGAPLWYNNFLTLVTENPQRYPPHIRVGDWTCNRPIFEWAGNAMVWF